MHNYWRGVDQHSTGHNQQPDERGKWWSNQTPKKRSFIVPSPWYTCAITTVSSTSWYDITPDHTCDWWMVLPQQRKRTYLHNSDPIVNTIWEKGAFVYIGGKNLRSLWSSYEKWEKKSLYKIFFFVYLNAMSLKSKIDKAMISRCFDLILDLIFFLSVKIQNWNF